MRKAAFSAIIIINLLFLMITHKSVRSENDERKLFLPLGDSIAYGMNAEQNKGYASQLYRYLKGISQYSSLTASSEKTAVPGLDSSDLLNLINANQFLLPSAAVITISIGGNNILPIVNGEVCKVLNISPDQSRPDELPAQVAKVIAQQPEALNKLIGLTQDKVFLDRLQGSAERFKSDWAQIVNMLKVSAPKAKIYVLTVYNPFSIKEQLFYSIFESYISGINSTIKSYNQYYNVVDVHDVFAQHTGEAITNFNMFAGNFDPHPNQLGHNIIFEAHIIRVNSIALNKASAKIKKGNSLALKFSISPENATNKDVKWSSSNDNIASVDNRGRVTAVRPGNTVITVETADGNKTSTCSISVKGALLTKGQKIYILVAVGVVIITIMIRSFVVKKR